MKEVNMLRNFRSLNSSCVFTSAQYFSCAPIISRNKLPIVCCHTVDEKSHTNLFSRCLKNVKHHNTIGYMNYSILYRKNCDKYLSNNTLDRIKYCTPSKDGNQNFKLRNTGNKYILNSVPKIIENYKQKLDPYGKLMRIDKPIGTWLLFWPGAWSILLASDPSICSLSTTAHTLALFLTGAFIMRGAGCTINDMWDKDIDAKVERTKDRPLVSGKLSQKQALFFLAGQLTIGLSILLQLNWYSVILGASSMVLVVLYPLTKRVTYYPQLVLGFCFNWGALLGWTALQGSLSPACLALYVAGVSWTLVYDTIYAHQDKRDDAIIGIKSTALKFGDSTKYYLSAFSISLVTSLSTAGILCGLDWPYYLLIGAVSTHIAKQIATLNMDNPKDCADKFVSNHRVGLLIFLGILLGKWKTWAEYLSKQESIESFKQLDQINTLA